MNAKFRGTGVALVTPFKENGSIDLSAFEKLVQHTISGGVNYLLVNGTTSESATTDKSEKAELLSMAKNLAKGKVSIVYGIGGNNTSELIKTIESTDFSGIDGILSVSPYYNKPSQEGIYKHYQALAQVSPVPLILYNVPGRTSSNISAKTTIRLSEIDNVAGIKEASGNIEQAIEIVKYARPGFMLISGDDLVTVPMISIGAQGVMSVLANAYPAEFSSMLNLALNNDYKKATEVLMKFVDLNPLLYEEGNPVGIKQVLEFKGICQSHVRLPLSPASAALKEKIKKTVF